MRKYAFIKNNIVMLIDNISQEDYLVHARVWDNIIDIEDVSPQPLVGWNLIGNKLLPTSPEKQQEAQQIFGAALSLEMVNRMGARNLTLSQSGEVVNVAAILTALGSVKALLETGALKTARSILQLYSPNFPSHQDILVDAISRITGFLQEKGWDQ